MEIEEYAKNALVNYEAALDSWKIRVLSVDTVSGDWADVTCTITKPRCRKPFVQWKLKMNMVRNIVDFEKVHFAIFSRKSYEKRTKSVDKL